MTSNQDFELVLDRYKNNLIEYKLGGNSAYKMALETDKAWLDSYIESLRNQSQGQQQYIQEFIANYQNANPDIAEMQEQIKMVRKEGPELQTAYETEKEAEKQEPLDFTPYYVKAGLIAGVVGVLAVTSFF